MNLRTFISLCAIVTLLNGCGGSGGGSNPAPVISEPTTPASVTLSGVVFDGPVSGGSLYVFSADTVQAALDSAADADDRQAALDDSNPIVSAVLGESEDGAYSLSLSGDLAGQSVFLVFDNTGAEDLTFRDTPFNLESVTVLGVAGSTNRVNVTPQTSIVATQVRVSLPLDASGVAAEIVAANANVVSAFGEDQTGRELLPEGTDVITLDDDEMLEVAATFLGFMVRSTAIGAGLEQEVVLEALALDALDGNIDGFAPGGAADAETLEAVSDLYTLGESDEPIVVGSCASTASLLWQACDIDIMDDFFEEVATCQNSDEDELDECIAEAVDQRDETQEECADIYAARQNVCQDLGDEVHEPEFGEAFADNFIDPLDIGDGEEPNPYFPLLQGNQWIYESTFIDEDDGEEITETITVTVTNKTKLIQGITCLVVNDTVEEDGDLIEDTDDWFAQDKDGNIWYCGEIAKNFELYEGDEPEIPELVDIEGSWKAGREGAKAGMLLPFEPTEGQVIRTEVLFGDAEDVVEILSVTGTEAAEGGSCDGNCLVTLDYSPLEPGAAENKYYAPGLGLILEVDLESGDRAELISFTNTPPVPVLADAKMLIEHNSTDKDTGFQGFADADAWNELTIIDAEGMLILTATALGGLADFGLTEFFFETSEPENAEVPIDDVIDRLPEGTYSFTGDLVEEGPAVLITEFSHDIPAGAELLTPEEDATGVDANNTVISWALVEEDIDEDDIEIVGYQVIVEEAGPAFDDDGFAKPVMSVYLTSQATSLTVPSEFMKTDGCYEFEVLAIEKTGNQTLASSAFETGGGCEEFEEEENEGLKDPKFLVEHNSTDEDTGFQGFIDGDPWNEMTITDADGVDIVNVRSAGGLFNFGLTELFFETHEPENAEVSIAEVLARMPEGVVTFTGDIVDGDESVITTIFTHDIPMGPVLLTPENEAEDVDPENTVVSWEAVTTDLDGDPVTIVGYQVIVEEDVESEFPTGFAQPVFSAYVSASTLSVTIPAEFMREETEYEYEVLAIEESGNQTLASAEFETGSRGSE